MSVPGVSLEEARLLFPLSQSPELPCQNPGCPVGREATRRSTETPDAQPQPLCDGRHRQDNETVAINETVAVSATRLWGV